MSRENERCASCGSEAYRHFMPYECLGFSAKKPASTTREEKALERLKRAAVAYREHAMGAHTPPGLERFRRAEKKLGWAASAYARAAIAKARGGK